MVTKSKQKEPKKAIINNEYIDTRTTPMLYTTQIQKKLTTAMTYTRKTYASVVMALTKLLRQPFRYKKPKHLSTATNLFCQIWRSALSNLPIMNEQEKTLSYRLIIILMRRQELRETYTLQEHEKKKKMGIKDRIEDAKALSRVNISLQEQYSHLLFQTYQFAVQVLQRKEKTNEEIKFVASVIAISSFRILPKHLYKTIIQQMCIKCISKQIEIKTIQMNQEKQQELKNHQQQHKKEKEENEKEQEMEQEKETLKEIEESNMLDVPPEEFQDTVDEPMPHDLHIESSTKSNQNEMETSSEVQNEEEEEEEDLPSTKDQINDDQLSSSPSSTTTASTTNHSTAITNDTTITNDITTTNNTTITTEEDNKEEKTNKDKLKEEKVKEEEKNKEKEPVKVYQLPRNVKEIVTKNISEFQPRRARRLKLPQLQLESHHISQMEYITESCEKWIPDVIDFFCHYMHRFSEEMILHQFEGVEIPQYHNLMRCFVSLYLMLPDQWHQLADILVKANPEALNILMDIEFHRTNVYQIASVWTVFNRVEGWVKAATSVPVNFRIDLIQNALDACIMADHFRLVSRTVLLIYNIVDSFENAIRVNLLSKTLFSNHFNELFLHWNDEVRQCFMRLIIYKIIYKPFVNTNTFDISLKSKAETYLHVIRLHQKALQEGQLPNQLSLSDKHKNYISIALAKYQELVSEYMQWKTKMERKSLLISPHHPIPYPVIKFDMLLRR